MTINDIIGRAHGLMNRKFKNAAPAAFVEQDAFRWYWDAAQLIADLVRQPQKITGQPAVAGNAQNLPTDIYDGVDGIVYLDIDGYPVDRAYPATLRELYEEEWLNPDLPANKRYYVEHPDSTKVYIVPPLGGTEQISFTHVQQITQPTATSDAIPDALESFVPHIPLYLVGRALELDKQGRGAAFIGEFEGRLLRRFRRKERRGRRVAGEAYTLSLKNYRGAYGRSRGRIRIS